MIDSNQFGELIQVILLEWADVKMLSERVGRMARKCLRNFAVGNSEFFNERPDSARARLNRGHFYFGVAVKNTMANQRYD